MRDEVGPRQPFRAAKPHGRQAPPPSGLVVFPCAPVLDAAIMAPDGLSHKFGITQHEHLCRDCLAAANIIVAVLAWDLPAGRYLTGARRRVLRTRSACIWSRCGECCSAAGALRPSCYWIGALNFSDAPD